MEVYYPALLDGRLVAPRKNMRLDFSVREVVNTCLKCCPANPEARFGLALEIAEKSPYLKAKMTALEHLGEQFKAWPEPSRRQCPSLPASVEQLIAISDLSDDREFKSASFAVAARIGGILAHDFFPSLFWSLTGETNDRCLADKFVAISTYLHVGHPANDPQMKEERLNQLLNYVQERIDAADTLRAVNLIFTIFEQYTYGWPEEIIFKKPPLDLATLQKICRQAPLEQQNEILKVVCSQLESLVTTIDFSFGGYFHELTRAALEAQRALIRFAFPRNPGEVESKDTVG